MCLYRDVSLQQGQLSPGRSAVAAAVCQTCMQDHITPHPEAARISHINFATIQPLHTAGQGIFKRTPEHQLLQGFQASLVS